MCLSILTTLFLTLYDVSMFRLFKKPIIIRLVFHCRISKGAVVYLIIMLILGRVELLAVERIVEVQVVRRRIHYLLSNQQ